MRRRFCVAPPSFRLGLHCSARRFHAQMRRTGAEWARAFYCKRAVVSFCVDFGLFELCRLRIASPVLRRSPKLSLGAPLLRTTISRPNASHGYGMGAGVLLHTGGCVFLRRLWVVRALSFAHCDVGFASLPHAALGAPLQRTTISRPNAQRGRGLGAGVLLHTGGRGVDIGYWRPFATRGRERGVNSVRGCEASP